MKIYLALLAPGGGGGRGGRGSERQSGNCSLTGNGIEMPLNGGRLEIISLVERGFTLSLCGKGRGRMGRGLQCPRRFWEGSGQVQLTAEGVN